MHAAGRAVRVRIAPSPTGDPHIGNMYVGLFNKVFALQHHGSFILRIEDTDRARYTAGAVDLLIASLRWLSLIPDEGPSFGGRYGPYVQSERLPIYRQHAERLIESGHAYACFCTPERLAAMRREQEARKQPPKYDRHCLTLTPSQVRERLSERVPHVVRFRMPDDGETSFDDVIRGTITVRNDVLDDQVLLKADGYPTYQLAAMVDDHLMEISHVIRGEEWISSTPKHVLLYRAFGWEPPVFAHMPLLRNRDRSKMSKRRNPTNVLWYREQGYLPQALVNFLGLMGWSHPDGREVFDIGQMVEHFRLRDVSLGGPIFDFKKLDWLNGVYIRQLSLPELGRLARPYLPEGASEETLGEVLPLVQERLKRLGEVGDLTSYFWTDRVEYDRSLLAVRDKSPDQVRGALLEALAVLSELESPDHATWEAALRAIAGRRGFKDGDLFMLVRVAVTGRTASPPLYETSVALGWPRVLERIGRALAMIPEGEV